MSDRMSDEDFQIISDYIDALKADGWEEGIGINEYIEMRDALKAERERVVELEHWSREMVEIQASGGKLDGYRELATKLGAMGLRAEAAKLMVADQQAETDFLMDSLVQQEQVLDTFASLINEALDDEGCDTMFEERLADAREQMARLSDWRTRDLLCNQRRHHAEAAEAKLEAVRGLRRYAYYSTYECITPDDEGDWIDADELMEALGE